MFKLLMSKNLQIACRCRASTYSAFIKNKLITNLPNILIVMVDQLNGTLFSDEGGPAQWLHAPNLKRLAKSSINFTNTYTPSPLCAPARASFMSGKLPQQTLVYDNAAEFQSSVPTFAHFLRRAGYYVGLSGKMHFVGPDQLHGFEERLTTDIYPADFGWTPDYRYPNQRIDWWYHNLSSVTEAGIAETTNQMEYDDEVEFFALQKIFQLSRTSAHSDLPLECDHPTTSMDSRRPWCLTVSFTHPHDPYVTQREFWDLYDGCEHLLPVVKAIPFEEQDQHSRRLLEASDYKNFPYSLDDVKRARRAYFSNISYIDRKIGNLMNALERTRQLDNTIIIFCSDHGDMLGERGLWFKMNFFEGSARVPLMISLPNQLIQNNNSKIEKGAFDKRPNYIVDTPVSLLDIAPTLVDITNAIVPEISTFSGESLVPLLKSPNNVIRLPLLLEYAAEGSICPQICIIRGHYKFIHCKSDPPQLFDLESDPYELKNLANNKNYSDLLNEFFATTNSTWDLEQFDKNVRRSQMERLIIYEALRNGAYYPWDFQPLQKASERYMRNHMDLNVVEHLQRFPRGE